MKKESPYYRLVFSCYHKEKFIIKGVVYLYMPKHINEIRFNEIIKKILKSYRPDRTKNGITQIWFNNFCLESYTKVTKQQYEINKGVITTQLGNFPTKIKVIK